MLGIMALVIDIGNALVLKNHMDNVVDMVVDISVSNKDISSDKLKNLLDYNLDYSENRVKVSDDEILIECKAYSEGIFSRVFGFKGFEVKSVNSERLNKYS